MKVFNFKSALAMLTFSAMSLFFQAPTQAQVNKKFLSDVIKSCHRDINVEYFKRMGILNLRETQLSSWAQESCIWQRYFYVSSIEQLPWLADSGEILPGYLASVAVANVFVRQTVTEDQIIECVTKKDFDGSNKCYWISDTSYINNSQYSQYKEISEISTVIVLGTFLPYICPKCVVAHDGSSESALKRGFIDWFLSLDKSKRRDVVSFLSSENIRQDLWNKKNMAVQAYKDALQKIEQDDKEQRRRNLLGQ